MGELDPADAAWLTSPEGLETVASVDRDLRDGDDVMVVGTRLRRRGTPSTRAAAVVAAAVARERARARWPDADQLLFTREGLEQASDPAVSAWRARRFAGDVEVEDRAAGCGGDTLALGAVVRRVTAVDLDAARLALLRHNATVRGIDVDTVVADAIIRPPPVGPVHADPGRRVDGRRVRRLAEHRPSVPALLHHLDEVRRGRGVAVVVGPGVDLDDPDLPAGVELEFVQLGRQLVEAVLWTGALRGGGAAATATILDPSRPADAAVTAVRRVATRSRVGRGPVLPVGPVGAVLIEVAPAAVRARLHDELGAELDARRLGRRRALLTADTDVPPSPWWQRREVEAVLPARAAAVRRHLGSVEPAPVEVVLHGVRTDPVAFHRALGGVPTGPDGRRVELVRTDDGAIAVVTRTLDPTPPP